MSGQTAHYGLQKLDAGEPFSINGYKYVGVDRDIIDTVLYQGATGHHHDGASGILTPPLTAPVLVLDAATGLIPSGTRVAYKYTYVDSHGNETAPSPETFVNTALGVVVPNAPTISTSNTGGTLLSGNYYYVLSSWETNTHRETRALHPIFITIPITTATNSITLTMPTLPVGGTGFNIYRRAPGDGQYFFLASQTGAGPYTDAGSVAPDCNRTLPSANSTFASNSINVELPAPVPAGYTWRLYRTYINGNYNNSFLHWVVEESSPGVITDEYLDLGYATTKGVPPTSTLTYPSPSKINLATEVQGVLPAANLGAVPFVVSFMFPGTLSPQIGDFLWICEFPQFDITACRAVLAIGSVPAAQDVIIDVNLYNSGSSTTIYTTQANRPKVTVGNTVGTRKVPNMSTLTVGQGLSVDVDQSGGGSTPTDRDLTINIYGMASGF